MTTADCLCRELAKRQGDCSSKCFGKLWLFESFSEEEYRLLQSVGRQRTFSKGQMVFLQGAPFDEMFLVKTGLIRLSKCFEDGSEVILGFRKSGELFGENALMGEEVFPMNAIAMEETLTCGAKIAGIEKIVLENPHIGWTMMKNMSLRIRALTARLESMAIGSLEERLFQTLTDIAKEHGVKKDNSYNMTFPLTHEELGFLVQAHRVSVTRALNNLLRSGRVARNGKMYLLPFSD